MAKNHWLIERRVLKNISKGNVDNAVLTHKINSVAHENSDCLLDERHTIDLHEYYKINDDMKDSEKATLNSIKAK